VAMIPDEKKLVERMKDRPFALLGINSDGAREALKKKLDAKGITWRSAVDGSTSGPIAKEWNINGWPTIYLIDDEGVIRYADAPPPELDELVEELVKKAEARRKR
jgi:hypothetical protein